MSFRYKFILFFLLHSCQSVDAQNHDHQWVFGYSIGNPNPPLESEFGRAIIDFNTTPTSVVKASIKLNFAITASTLSDSVGHLLYYTNGIQLRNSKHQLIENGDSLNYSIWWDGDVTYGMNHYMGGFSLPYPGHPNQYFYFHQGYDILQDSFATHYLATPDYYTVIDMGANNGNGKVLKKNQKLLTGNQGWPAACKHGNGRDWWVTFFSLDSTKQQTYLLSPDGLLGPFIQDIGPGFPLPESVGKTIFSPDGRIYVRNDAENGLRIMDFDRCTGLFSNLRIVPYPPEIYTWSAAFSPNSRFLYLSNPGTIWRIDLQAPDISESLDTVSLFNGYYCPTALWKTHCWQMQEGADGKIYIASLSSNRCMSRIEHPNLPGEAADMAWGSFSLPRWNDYTICDFPNYRLGEYDNSPCDTVNLQKPGDGFAYTPYRVGELSTYRGSKNDYTILPMLLAKSNEDARREKKKFLHPKYTYQRYLDCHDPSKRPQPEQAELLLDGDRHE